jgi:hypothetical protein
MIWLNVLHTADFNFALSSLRTSHRFSEREPERMRSLYGFRLSCGDVIQMDLKAGLMGLRIGTIFWL